MSNILKINVSTLENYQNEFNNEFNNFKNSANSTFENSYLNRSSDSIVRSMCSGLQSHYSRIEKGYTNINNWWISYINNVYNLENFLAGNCGTNGIDDPATLFAIGYLFNLEGYENIIEDTFSVNSDSYSSTFSFDDPTLLANQTADQENSNQDKNLLATVATTGLSFLEGLGKFGEAIVDAECLGYAVMATPYTGIVDGFQFLYCKITGNEWESVTKKMWNETKAFVAEEHVTDWVDNFYENDRIGQVLKNNSYHFNEIRNISSGIGYGTGVIILTVATFGAGGAVVGGTSAVAGGAAAASGGVTAANLALTAGVAALGRETEAAWADGADTVEGLVRGAVGGLWEAGQYYLGGQINQLNLFGNGGIFKGATSSALNNIMNIGVRAVLDGADAGLDSAVQPLMNAIYKDGYYNTNGEYVEFSSDASFADKYEKLFEENGGMKGVLINAAIGSGISLISELGNLFKKPKTLEGEIVDNDNYIENPKQGLPPRQDVIDAEGYSVGFDYETLDGEKIDLSSSNSKGNFADVSRKGLPSGSSEIDFSSDGTRTIVDGASKKLDVFDDVEMPKQKVNDLISGVEEVNLSNKKSLYAKETLFDSTTKDLESVSPLEFSRKANPRNMPKMKINDPVSYTPSIDSKNKFFTRTVFEETSDFTYGFGNDQGFLRKLQYYVDDSGNYITPGSEKYRNAIKSGKKLTINQSDWDMARVYNLLTSKYKMSFEDAVRTAQLIDVDEGVCSYAATLDNLTMLFLDRQQEFYDRTGIPLFVKGNSKSGARINTAELLTDFYVTVNNVKCGGQYFKTGLDGSTKFTGQITVDQFGNAFRDGKSRQVYLSDGFDGVNITAINKYLKKNGFTERVISDYWYGEDIKSKMAALSKAISAVDNGEQIQMGLFVDKNSPDEIRFLNKNGHIYETTKTWKEGGGHEVKIIGSTGNGVLISTWGEELMIPFDDIISSDAYFDFSHLYIK